MYTQNPELRTQNFPPGLSFQLRTQNFFNGHAMGRRSSRVVTRFARNEAPRSSLLRRSSRFGCEGRKLRGILRNFQKPLPSFAKAMEGSPRLHPRSTLRGIRRRRINE